MNTDIIVALITSVLTFAGVIVTVVAGNKRQSAQIKAQLKESNDLTLYRIAELEKKQDKHNSLIERMVRAEDDIVRLDERINKIEGARK